MARVAMAPTQPSGRKLAGIALILLLICFWAPIETAGKMD